MTRPDVTGRAFITARALAIIERHEGFSQFPRSDANYTLQIGFGTNLSRRGIHRDEASTLALRDICEAEDELQTYAFWASIGEARQVALLDLAYCVGIAGVGHFSRMLAFLGVGQYEQAADELLASKFAGEVRGRAADLAYMIRSGNFLAEDNSEQA